MSPLGIVTAGLQLLSSWLMSVIAVLALFVSVVVCLAFVEFVCDGSSIAQAYTVKPPDADVGGGSTSRTSAT